MTQPHTGPVVLLSIPNTLSTRNLLRTGVLSRLKAAAARVVIVAPFANDPAFRDEFVRDNVIAYPMPKYQAGRREDLIFRILFNLYLAGETSASMQLFLNRWIDNHPRLGTLRRAFTRHVLRRLTWLAPVLERLYTREPALPAYLEMLHREQPDVAVFSRLFFCDEIPLMRAARQLGIATVGAVASWDNLTNKGPLLPRLERLLVWNDLLHAEATRLHGFAADAVSVTGAPHHDMLFSQRHEFIDRASFFSKLGLDPAKRLITYAGEDPIIAPDAPHYVQEIHRWVTGNQLAVPCQLLVRPHPQDDLSRYDEVRKLPGVFFDLPGRLLPGQWMDMHRDDLKHLYETLMHSDVMINVSSTIVVDAAFFDTPSVCIGYGYTHAKTYFNLPMRFFEMDHYRYVIDAGATVIVQSPEDLRAAIDRYLLDRSLESEGRQRIARLIAGFDDGRSAERTAAAIMAAARDGMRRAAIGVRRTTVETAAPASAI